MKAGCLSKHQQAEAHRGFWLQRPPPLPPYLPLPQAAVCRCHDTNNAASSKWRNPTDLIESCVLWVPGSALIDAML